MRLIGNRKGIPNKTNKYETEVLPRLTEIKDWIVQGDTIQDICKKLSISHDSWYRYCKEHETLSELVNMAQDLLNHKVEKSLLKLCSGFEYEEIKTIVEEDKNGKKRTRIEKTKKYQPPSSNALSFWLRNRSPDKWNEKRELIIDTKDNEEARKKLFLEMIEDDIVEADYSVEDSLIENIQEKQEDNKQ